MRKLNPENGFDEAAIEELAERDKDERVREEEQRMEADDYADLIQGDPLLWDDKNYCFKEDSDAE